MWNNAWLAETTHFCEATFCDAYIIGIGMRRVPLRRKANAPFFKRGYRLAHVMIVLAFAEGDLPERADLIELPHRIEVFVETRSLEHHVLLTILLHRFIKFIGVFERSKDSGYRYGYVLTTL